MNPRSIFRRTAWFLPLTLAPMLAFGAQAPPSQPAQTPDASAAQTDAASKAAERKKRFERQERLLEEAEASSSKVKNSQVPTADPDQTLFVSPAMVTMRLGESHSFSAFHLSGLTITDKAEWSISNPSVATLSTEGGPTITSTSEGTVLVRARVGSRTAEASVKIVSADQIPAGTILWSTPQIPGYAGKQIVQAVPTPSGPDMYGIDEGADGTSLIRALMSDGRQMWMRKMSSKIVGAVPH